MNFVSHEIVVTLKIHFSFTSACAHLYSHVTKPLLDATTVSFSLIRVLIFSWIGISLNDNPQIAQEQHANTSLGPLIAGSVVFFTGKILRMVSPKFGALVADEAARKGYLRFIHSRFSRFITLRRGNSSYSGL